MQDVWVTGGENSQQRKKSVRERLVKRAADRIIIEINSARDTE